MADQTKTHQFCRYVQQEAKMIRAAILDPPRAIAYSQPHHVPSLLQQQVLARGDEGSSNRPGLPDLIQNPNCGRTRNRRKHGREVPPSSSRPPCWALAPVIQMSSGDDETAPEKTRRRKLCSMIRKHGECTKTKCPKWHPMTETETVETQRLEQRQATSPPPPAMAAETEKEKSKKSKQQEQQQVTKQVSPAPMPKVEQQRKSPGRGLMDQITKITNPDSDDSEDEDDLSSSSQDSNPRQDEIKTEVYTDQPKQPEISPHFQQHPASKAKGKRQHLAVAAMGDDKPIPLEAAWVWCLAGGRYRE